MVVAVRHSRLYALAKLGPILPLDLGPDPGPLDVVPGIQRIDPLYPEEHCETFDGFGGLE